MRSQNFEDFLVDSAAKPLNWKGNSTIQLNLIRFLSVEQDLLLHLYKNIQSEKSIFAYNKCAHRKGFIASICEKTGLS